MAVKRGHVEIVEYLLECAAIVNAQTSTGETALMYASENGHIAIINLLLQFGAQLVRYVFDNYNLLQTSSPWKKRNLIHFVWGGEGVKMRVIKLLLYIIGPKFRRRCDTSNEGLCHWSF